MNTEPKIVRTQKEIQALPLGTKLYKPTETNVRWWHYAGVNPMSVNHIMCVTAGNVAEIECFYMAGHTEHVFYLDYREACEALLENAKENVEKVQRIFIDKM